MKALLLFLALNIYIVTLQTKGGVRTKTTIEAQSLHEAKQLAKEMYKDKIVVSVTLKKK